MSECHVGTSDKEEHMLHLNTDAPYGLVRDIMVMAKGFVEPATSDLPL